MWKAIITLSCILMVFPSAFLYAEEQKGPLLTFASDKYDCGTIYYEDDDIKTIEIEFSNTGDAPLIVEYVNACCGTIVSHRPSEPILPGENATIGVRFRVMSKPHTIRRVISVRSNSIDEPLKRHHITGRVEQKAE